MTNNFFPSVVIYFLLLSGAIHAGDKIPVKPKLTQSTEKGRIFIINNAVRDLDDFKKLVLHAVKLKPYGKVRVNISTLSANGYHDIPPKGSPWHEYASSNPTPGKFFPDSTLVRFIPATFVGRNRQLLLEKARILREHDLEAAFLGYEPNFLSAAFFHSHPEMLGPRVDHPRRSTQKEFAPCIHAKETRTMYANMMAEMLKAVPEIKTFSFKTNDAGAGMCWAEWLYTGPNGPAVCRNVGIGETIKLLLNSYKEGAARAGRDLSIYLDEASSNFTDEEKVAIQQALPANCFYQTTDDRSIRVIAGPLNSFYPVRGILNPSSIVKTLHSGGSETDETIIINFRAAYDRGSERADIAGDCVDLIKRVFEDKIPGTQLSKQIYKEWGGEKSYTHVENAYAKLDEAQKMKSETFPKVSTQYWGVTTRLINRPLVIAPQLLSPDEERYFLPYVFNISREEARDDYMYVHGVHQTIPKAAVAPYVQKIIEAAVELELIDKNSPRKKFFDDLALALRMHGCIIRSCGNFAAAQAIRDRDSALLNGPPHLPNKLPTWEGHPDFIEFNNIMRDELDNTNEFIAALQKGGSRLMVYASDPSFEDRFIVSHNLLNQLKQKRKIMLHHWQDIEQYLSSPFK